MLAVPNISEGRESDVIEAITAAFTTQAELLDRHIDVVHNRTVLSLAAIPPRLSASLAAGARECVRQIDISRHQGAHPCIGALDVCPAVYLDETEHDLAREVAQSSAEEIAALGIPVFFYGELASSPERSERAFFRRGGLTELTRRLAAGELEPDLGPAQPHPEAGATLVTARPPLAAFNLELDTSDVRVAQAIAAKLREQGGGPVGVRAIGIDLDGVAQVSTNIHDPVGVPLAEVIELVRALAARHHARPVAGEVVGLVPEAAIRDLPPDVTLRDFDPDRQVIERRLGLASPSARPPSPPGR